MLRWGERDGYDWQLLDLGDDGPVILGVTFGYGLLDESVADYGTLQYLATALKVELSRPVELAGGGVGVGEVLLDPNSDTFTVAVRGDRETVAGAWRRLPEFFTTAVDVPPEGPYAADTWGWTRDAFMRTGANAFGLTLLTARPAGADQKKVELLRAHLDPAAGQVGCVFFTSDESLVGAATFTRRELPDALPPQQPRAQGHRVPGTIPASYGGLLYFTAVVPRTEAGFAAGLVLRSHFGAALKATGMPSAAVGCTIRGLGQDLWVAVETEQLPSVDVLHRALVMTASSPIPDTLVDAVVEEVAGSSPSGRVRERRALGLPDGMALSRAEVRAALVQAMRTLHLSDFGKGGIPGFPSLDEAPSEEVRTTYKSDFSADELEHFGLPRKLSLGQRSLAALAGGDHDVVDLDQAAFVIDYTPGCLCVFDHRCVGIEVDARVYADGEQLLERLEERLAGVPRLAQPVEQPDVVAQALRSGGSTKRRRWLAVGGAVLSVVFVIVMIVVQNASKPEPVTERISVGQAAKLAGGTKLTVQAVERTAAEANVVTLTVTVRACAGEDIDGTDDVDPAVQRTIGPSNFQLTNVTGAAGMRVEDDRPQLQTATLPRGECTTGDLIYRLQGDPSELRVGYANPFGDDVVWYVR